MTCKRHAIISLKIKKKVISITYTCKMGVYRELDFDVWKSVYRLVYLRLTLIGCAYDHCIKPPYQTSKSFILCPPMYE